MLPPVLLSGALRGKMHCQFSEFIRYRPPINDNPLWGMRRLPATPACFEAHARLLAQLPPCKRRSQCPARLHMKTAGNPAIRHFAKRDRPDLVRGRPVRVILLARCGRYFPFIVSSWQTPAGKLNLISTSAALQHHLSPFVPFFSNNSSAVQLPSYCLSSAFTTFHLFTVILSALLSDQLGVTWSRGDYMPSPSLSSTT